MASERRAEGVEEEKETIKKQRRTKSNPKSSA